MLQTRFRIMLAFVAVGTALILPLPCGATTQVLLEWQPNTDSDLAGYRVFSRLEGENYDYTEPSWVGTQASCVIDIPDEELNYYFVVRALSTTGTMSPASGEVCYGCTICPDDPEKVYAGFCGCGTLDRDIDVDGIWDCYDTDIDSDYYDRWVNPSDLTETSESAGCFIEGLYR